MRLPKDDAKLVERYREIREVCLASRQDRRERYSTNRQWFLHGALDTRSPWNKIYSHLDTVSSFLYASDSTQFSWKLGALAPKTDHDKANAAGKRVNEEWKSSNADIIAQQAILWALVYDSTFMKLIRRGGQIHPFVVDPGSMGVYREDVPMLDRQEAIAHVYYMTVTDLERQLVLHPKRDEILRQVTATASKQDTASDAPAIVDRVVMTGAGPLDTLQGEVNVPLDVANDYVARIDAELVEMCELWIWDDAEDDYRVVTMASDITCVYDRSNIFIPRNKALWEGEQPFIQFCPNPLYDYFWGIAEIDRLSGLQAERNDRMKDIKRLLRKQVDPPNAWSGMGISEEKLNAFNVPGANLYFGQEGAKRESFVPTIPNDLYVDIRQNDAEFDEVSGITNVLAGRGESGVRSSGHASKLASLASSRPKKRALIVEDSLEKAATLYGKCIYMDDAGELEDEQGHKFIIAQMSPHFIVEVDAHSNSPVFMESQRENAAGLFKARAIDREDLIEMIAPPMKERLIRKLREKIIPAEKKAAEAQQQAEVLKGKGGPLTAVK